MLRARELKSEAGSRVGALPRLAGASDGADARGIDRKLGPVPQRLQGPADYFFFGTPFPFAG